MDAYQILYASQAFPNGYVSTHAAIFARLGVCASIDGVT